MKADLSTTIRSFLSTRKEIIAKRKTKAFALAMNKCFNRLSMAIKKGEFVYDDYRAVSEDNKKFLSENSEDYFSQNVNRNQDYKRANKLLIGVMILSSILAVKGLIFFSEEFYATLPKLIIVLIALVLVWFFVKGSIYLNTFAIGFREDNRWKFYLGKVAAFAFILFIPSMNLFEGIDSQYSAVVMALNIFAIFVDIILNTALVSMSNIFIVSENAESAKKIVRKKAKARQSAERMARSFNAEFLNKKNAFTEVAKQFIANFKELQQKYPKAAESILSLVDNFTIFMVNNKVYQHAVLPYHADEDGHPVVEKTFFSPEMDSISQGYDQYSKTNLTVTSLPNQAKTNSAEEEEYRQIQDSTPKEAVTASAQSEIIEVDEESQPPDYETIIENNADDKYL